MSEAKLSRSSRAETVDDDDDSILSRSEQINRPPDTAIGQQRVKAWHPILDPEYCIYAYLFLAIIFIPVGKYRLIALALRRCCL